MKYTAAMFVLLAARLAGAPPPKLVREIALSKILTPQLGFIPYTTFAFSPDENWLAVAVSARPADPRNNNHIGLETLLLVPLHGTADQTVQIQPDLRPEGNPLWSPDSAAVLVQGVNQNSRNPYKEGIVTIWDLEGNELLRRNGPGLSADIPAGGVFGFLDASHLLARRIPAKGPPAFETINLQGGTADTWTVPKHWRVVDMSPDRSLLAVLTDRFLKTLIVEYPSKKVILSKDNPYGRTGGDGGSWQYFTEKGKTLCSVGSVGRLNPELDTVTECWDVDSGKKVAQFDGFRGGAPAAASSGGSRLVLTHNTAFPLKNSGLLFPRGERIVWDFRSDTVVASWEAPQVASVGAMPIYDSAAISASARYVAESAGAVFRIYELP
jgi:hypothetical protein